MVLKLVSCATAPNAMAKPPIPIIVVVSSSSVRRCGTQHALHYLWMSAGVGAAPN